MFDLLQNVQPKFLMLTKRDRKKGQWDTGRDVRVGGEQGRWWEQSGVSERVAEGQEGLLGVSGAVG